MAISSKISEYERSKLAVWKYPVSTFFLKLWSEIGKNDDYGVPADMDEAIFRMKNGTRINQNQFAFLGNICLVRR